jgi:hypothetical protein
MGGWMGGWVDGSKSHFKDCLQQSKTSVDLVRWLQQFFQNSENIFGSKFTSKHFKHLIRFKIGQKS